MTFRDRAREKSCVIEQKPFCEVKTETTTTMRAHTRGFETAELKNNFFRHGQKEVTGRIRMKAEFHFQQKGNFLLFTI